MFAAHINCQFAVHLLINANAELTFTGPNNSEINIPSLYNNIVFTRKPLLDLMNFEEEISYAAHYGTLIETLNKWINTKKLKSCHQHLTIKGDTLLHYIIELNVTEEELSYVVNLYKINNFNLDVKNVLGETPLYSAIRYNDKKAIELLINSGADPFISIIVNSQPISIIEQAIKILNDESYKVFYTACIKKNIFKNSKLDFLALMNDRIQNIYSKLSEIPDNSILTHRLMSSKEVDYQTLINPLCQFSITDEPKEPIIDNQIDRLEIEKWMSAHTGDYYTIASKIAHHIDYVSFESFINQLKLTFKDFFNQLNRYSSRNKSFCIVLPSEYEKSNAWVVSLALKYNLLDYMPYTITDVDNLEDIFSDNLNQYNLLFIDDASYSGCQMHNEQLNYVSREIGALFENEAHKVKYHLVIPYMTDRAIKTIQRTMDVYISAHQRIETISDKVIFTEEELNILKANQVNNAPNTPRDSAYTFIPNELTLFYFQHKIPDAKSSLWGIFALGRTIQAPYRLIPFIKDTIEPYKNKFAINYDKLTTLILNQNQPNVRLLPPLSEIFNPFNNQFLRSSERLPLTQLPPISEIYTPSANQFLSRNEGLPFIQMPPLPENCYVNTINKTI